MHLDQVSGLPLTEDFAYDDLNRLTGVTGPANLALEYADNGNIINKSDANNTNGGYDYDLTKKHAVTTVNDPATSIPSFTQDIIFNNFNKVESITEDNYNMQFTYGPQGFRKKVELYHNSTLQSTKYYSGSYEKEIAGSTTKEWHYIAGGDGLAAIYINDNGSKNMYYVLKDHLGSILALVDETGTPAEEYSFDAWGRRRNPTDWTYSSVPAPALLTRGYTGHEHLDEFGIINMNGRLYDPVLGRMLSPDPVVEAPGFTQSYNRYTYVFNNPLKYTDPTGYCITCFENTPLPPMHQNGDQSRLFTGMTGGSGSGNTWGYGGINGAANWMNNAGLGANWVLNDDGWTFQNYTPTYDMYSSWRSMARSGSSTYEANEIFVPYTPEWHKTNNSGSDKIWGFVMVPDGKGGYTFINYVPGGVSGVERKYLDFDNTNIALTIGGGLFGAARGLVVNGDRWLGKNGKYYTGFSGKGPNQFTGGRSGVFRAASQYKWAGRAALGTAVVLGGIQVYNGYQMDGGQYGYNAQVATGSAVGSIAGGWAGAALGAKIGGGIGALFGGVGAIPGAVIGGFVGGIVGSFSGGYIGEESMNYYYR